MSSFWGSKNSFGAQLLARMLLCLTTLLSALPSAIAECDLPSETSAPTEPSLGQKYDFLTNYGNYMPRVHCLRTAEGSPDWPWISLLIALNFIIVAGYLRIFHFWRGCYHNEEPRDRDGKLMDLAWVFALCATCGYGLSIIIFFWPVYRLAALAMVGLAIVTWKFAFDLEPFRKSFTAHRLHRQLSEALQRDNSELEAKNQQLQHAHARLAAAKTELEKTNEDLDEFVYAASHDLKSPLRAICSLSQFVVEDLGDTVNEQSKNDLEQMQSRVQRMERMLDGLLHYSRVGRLEYTPETFEIDDAIRQAVAVLDVPSEFEIQIEPSKLVTSSPRPLFEQVVRNLVDNALKHHPRTDGCIKISARQLEQSIAISIADDGNGIAAEYQERIFEMFKTLRRRDEFESNGMGLALVKRIVERQGGTITVESKDSLGAMFRFTWPIGKRRTVGKPQFSRVRKQVEGQLCAINQ